MGQYVNDKSVAVNMAKVLLMLVNMVSIVSGSVLIYFAQSVKTSGWLEAFKGDYAWIGDTTILFVMVLGGVVVALAILGCFGAWQRNRIVLTIYAAVVVITAGLFVVVAVGGNSVKSNGQDWLAASFPAAPEENAVGANFNTLYCLAQVPYYCGEGDGETVPAQRIAGLFDINIPASILSTLTVSELCKSASRPAQLEQLCQVCEMVNTYAEYAPVYEWASSFCEPTDANQLWCGKLVVNGGNSNSSKVLSDGSPYSGCREPFLELVVKWSTFLFALGLIAAIMAGAVLGLSCIVRQGTDRPFLDDSFVVDSPSPRESSRRRGYY